MSAARGSVIAVVEGMFVMTVTVLAVNATTRTTASASSGSEIVACMNSTSEYPMEWARSEAITPFWPGWALNAAAFGHRLLLLWMVRLRAIASS